MTASAEDTAEILPTSDAPVSAATAHPTVSAVNLKLPPYGTRSLTLNLGLRRTFHWAFIVADVRKPILGADLLYNFSLLVDVKHHQLLNGLTRLRVQGIATQDPPLSPTLQRKEPVNDFAALLREFPSVTRPCITDHPP